MAVYRRSSRARFTLLLLVLTAITILTLDARHAGPLQKVRDGARDVFAPVADAVDSVLRPVGNFFEGVIHYGDLKAENARLREQLAQRNGTELAASDAQRQLKQLADINNLSYAGDIPAVAARVVSTSPSNFQLTIEIDRGRDAGVAVGMPVVAGEGLVGRVVDASRKRATVLLLTDSSFNVGVRLTGSGEVGVATGGGNGPMPVGLIPPAAKVAKDEVVVTSGLQQSVYPAGIPVGKVVEAIAKPGALEQTITIDPVVDLRRLTFVKVLQWSPDSRPASTTTTAPGPTTATTAKASKP